MQRRPASQKPNNCKSRQRSSLLSWVFNRHESNNDPSLSATIDEDGSNTETINNYNNAREYYMRSSLSAPTTAPLHREADKHISTDPRRDVQQRQPISRTEIVVTNSIECNPDNNINEPMIQIPNRRQSHLYTPFHDQFQGISRNNNDAESVISDASSKRKSCYVSHLSPIPDQSNSTSLSRSASWQPSSSSAPSSALLSPHQLQNATIDNIPARRTSRNYSEDPEIQAKLDAILNSEKTYFMSHALHNTNDYYDNNNTNNNNSSNGALNKNNTNMYRRSTTPANRPL